MSDIRQGDCLESLRALPSESVRCCVTSPPYWGLRDYGFAGQIGLEPTPSEYVARLVEVFREVRRVLAGDGTLFLNLGDSYAATSKGSGGTASTTIARGTGQGSNAGSFYDARFDLGACRLKPKDLVGIPWRVAFALQADGWYLRSDIIWAKPNPMPESVTDRPTKSHEYVFLLAKSERYYFDADAVKEPAGVNFPPNHPRTIYDNTPPPPPGQPPHTGLRRTKARTVRPGVDTNGGGQGSGAITYDKTTRNVRTVWTIATQPYSGAHFATFPEALAERCIRAGSAVGDTVLDPFGGSGTVGVVALRWGRDAILCEGNPEYVALARKRIAQADAEYGTHLFNRATT